MGLSLLDGLKRLGLWGAFVVGPFPPGPVLVLVGDLLKYIHTYNTYTSTTLFDSRSISIFGIFACYSETHSWQICTMHLITSISVCYSETHFWQILQKPRASIL